MANDADTERIAFPDYPPVDETGTVDLWQIEANLALTHAERMKRFESFLELCQTLRAAGQKHYGDLPATDPEAA
jgi:hypothetical protein